MSNSIYFMASAGSALLVSSILAGCDGGSAGGGGGSSGGGTNGTLSEVVTSGLDSEWNGNGDEITHRFTAKGDDLRLILRVESGSNGVTEPIALYVNGEEQESSTFAHSYEAVVYSDGALSKAAAFVTPIEDKLTWQNDVFIEREGPVWQLEGVKYGYLIGSKGETPSKTEADDGSITYDGTSWKAALGGVSLEGTLDGYNVSGEAKLDDMSGGFAGYDGVYKRDDYTNNWSYGSFAGDNGTDSSFAGSWDWFGVVR